MIWFLMSVALQAATSSAPAAQGCQPPPIDHEGLQRLAEDRQRVAKANSASRGAFSGGLLGLVASASAANGNAKLASDQQEYDEKQKHDLLVYEACVRAVAQSGH